MKRLYSIALAAFCLIAFSESATAQALVKNNGATFVVEEGAVVVIEGGIENTNNGTIDNRGTIELEGDFDPTRIACRK